MADNISDFKEIVREIEGKQILLPDFQRDFVWKDEEKQRKIVASVLTRMPIGSILLLTSKPDEYCSKIIGRDAELDTKGLTGNVDYLLDGQQRITVLTNVFSNVIHDNCPKVSELVSPSMKRRFFLRLPKWEDVYSGKEEDLFGIKTVSFPMQNPDSDVPEFLSGQVLDFIETQSFNANDNKPYNPHNPITPEIDRFCTNFENGYLIPLYMLIPSGSSSSKKNQIMKRYKDIVDSIAMQIKSEITAHYVAFPSDNEKVAFVKEMIVDDPSLVVEIINSGTDMDDKFEEAIISRKDVWIDQIKSYLDSCVKTVSLSQIKVGESQRSRAIDIYENLNMGGVSLNTFDLIMARVAKVNKKNFLLRLREQMEQKRSYPDTVLSNEIKLAMGDRLVNQTHNATVSTKCIEKGEINTKYIDAFLDVLCLYCNNTDANPDSYKVDNIKKDSILKLLPEQIDKNCDKIIDALDRAMFFLETRCGIRYISEVNYNLIIVLIATVFTVDSNYYNPKVHDLLEAWYWSVVFSGEYDKDQNSHMINNLQNIVRRISNTTTDISWLRSIKDNVLKMTNFSDKDLLLMDKVSEDRFPKPILRSFMCQYLLSKTYVDMFDANKRISVFCPDADSLEAHHVVPLGSAKKVGEVTSMLRKDNKHICNSPLNFVYITREANKAISDDSIEVYERAIQPAAKTALYITSYTAQAISNESKLHELLENRYTMLYGDITNKISTLLINW